MSIRHITKFADSRGATNIEYCAVAACLMLGLLTAVVDSRNKLANVYLNATVGVSLGQADTEELEFVYGGSTEGTRRLFNLQSSSSGGGGCGKTPCDLDSPPGGNGD
ncbi:MAG: hypothetical protein KDD66_14730 [Bdellovibrionales bacterium]|nr:hypothetical protein [Bdellovibrionales bacterium]